MTFRELILKEFETSPNFEKMEKSINDLENFRRQNPALAQSLKGLDDLRNNVIGTKVALSAKEQQDLKAKEDADKKAKQDAIEKNLAAKLSVSGAGNTRKIAGEKPKGPLGAKEPTEAAAKPLANGGPAGTSATHA